MTYCFNMYFGELINSLPLFEKLKENLRKIIRAWFRPCVLASCRRVGCSNRQSSPVLCGRRIRLTSRLILRLRFRCSGHSQIHPLDCSHWLKLTFAFPTSPKETCKYSSKLTNNFIKITIRISKSKGWM